MELTTIRLDVQDYVAVVTIDRPPVNALSPELTAELTATFDAFTDRDSLRDGCLASRLFHCVIVMRFPPLGAAVSKH